MRDMTFEEEIDVLINLAKRHGACALDGGTAVDLARSHKLVARARRSVLIKHAKSVKDLSRLTEEYNRICEEYAANYPVSG